MTSIQVEYWKNFETQRHNLEMERLGKSEFGEAVRHNKQAEAIGFAQAAAAQWQARVAEFRAQTDQAYYRLAETKQNYEIALLNTQAQVQRTQAKLNEANASLANARAFQQELESGVYQQYGEDQARANYHGTVAKTYDTWAHFGNLVAKTGTDIVSFIADLKFPTGKSILRVS